MDNDKVKEKESKVLKNIIRKMKVQKNHPKRRLSDGRKGARKNKERKIDR